MTVSGKDKIMRILIVNPPRVDGYPVVREERYEHKDMGAVYPPLNLLYTAAVLEKQKHDVHVIDANGFNITLSELKEEMDQIRPEIVITRCGFDTQDEDVKVLKYAKEKHHAVTIIRNKIISEVLPLKKEFLKKHKFIDIFVDYELDLVISSLIKNLNALPKVNGISYLKGNKLITTRPFNIKSINIDTLPYPAYHLLPDLKHYHTGVLNPPFALVSTSRGCPFQCSFCAYARMGYRIRKPENIILELQYLKQKLGMKNFLFFDDLLGLNKQQFISLLKQMIQKKLNLKWVGCTRANLLTEEIVLLMKRSGCVEMAIGIESGAEKVLKMTKKGVTLNDIRNAAGLLKKAGILFYGLAIIGLPGETKQTIEETIRFIREIDPFYTQFCFATPFPNTEIYQYYEKNNLLLTRNWQKYSPLAPEPVIRTKELSKQQLMELRSYIYKKLILRPGYLIKKIRLLDWKWNIEGLIKITHRIIAILKKKMIR